MSDTGWSNLRDLLLDGYADFARRLGRRLGSDDLANEALHETYLRLERGGEAPPIHSPRAYLMRMAMNVANTLRVAERRRIGVSEGEALLELIDERPDPERAALARKEIEALDRAVGEMPARRQEIFRAVFREEASQRQIAERLGISVRTVQLELSAAIEHCALRLGRGGEKRFASTPPDASFSESGDPLSGEGERQSAATSKERVKR